MTEWVLREVLKEPKTYQWADRLNTFLTDIRKTALNWKNASTIGPIESVPIEKKRGSKQYRIISRLSPKDSLICSGFAAYLRDRIDPILSPSAFAFRSSRVVGLPCPQHHDTIKEIRHLNGMSASNEIWCAEADIQCFFDAINHSILRAEIRRVLAHADSYYSLPTSITTDVRLLLYINRFLLSYNYEDALSALLISGATPSDAEFPNPRSKVDEMGLPKISGPIGIPQGTALSCVLANIIMAPADTILDAHIRGLSDTSSSLYMRFCDDIIIASNDRGLCAQMMASYIATLRHLRLPYHVPQDVGNYDKDFWSQKSKNSYRWSSDGQQDSVPWFSFVGYEVLRDTNKVRVRLKSVKKEREKQAKVCLEIVGKISRRLSKNKAEPPPNSYEIGLIRWRTLMHFLSIGVGYPEQWQTAPSPHGVSWCTGFRAIQPDKSLKASIALDRPFQQLDRHRTRILKILHNRLYKIKRMLKKTYSTRHIPTQTEGASLSAEIWGLSFLLHATVFALKAGQRTGLLFDSRYERSSNSGSAHPRSFPIIG
jgi:hypothetical protein